MMTQRKQKTHKEWGRQDKGKCNGNERHKVK